MYTTPCPKLLFSGVSAGTWPRSLIPHPVEVKNNLAFNKVRQIVGRRKKQLGTWYSPANENSEALLGDMYLTFTCGLGCRAIREVYSVRNHHLIFGIIGRWGCSRMDWYGMKNGSARTGMEMLEDKITLDSWQTRHLFCENHSWDAKKKVWKVKGWYRLQEGEVFWSLCQKTDARWGLGCLAFKSLYLVNQWYFLLILTFPHNSDYLNS